MTAERSPAGVSPVPSVIGSVTILPSTRTSSGIGNGRLSGHLPADLEHPVLARRDRFRQRGAIEVDVEEPLVVLAGDVVHDLEKALRGAELRREVAGLRIGTAVNQRADRLEERLVADQLAQRVGDPAAFGIDVAARAGRVGVDFLLRAARVPVTSGCSLRMPARWFLSCAM